jgi:putative ATP-dependent DNA ligase
MEEEVSKALGVEAWRLKGAISRGTVRIQRDFHPHYLVFKKDMSPIERGTCVFLGDVIEVIRGFPKIRRAFYLKTALESHFGGSVAVEEKMNGYNVRCIRLGKRILALTRGGYICPYTTRKLREEKGIRNFFKENSDVLCGEVVGTENPYVVHSYEEVDGFGFFVFDIREKGTNVSRSIPEKYATLELYQIKGVRLFGIFQKGESISKVIEEIERMALENREGVVLKDPDMKIPPLKYTCSLANTGDLRHAFKFPYDYGRDFFFSRIIREGYQAVEFGEGKRELSERAARLGESILLPMVDTIQRILRGERVTEDFMIRVKTRGEIKEVIEHFEKQGVNCMVGSVKEVNGELLVEIKRLRPATNDKIKSTLIGKIG